MTNALCQSSLIPFLAFLSNVIIQFAVSCRRPQLGIVKSLFAGLSAGALLYLFLEARIWNQHMLNQTDFLALAAVNWVVYFSISYCYFHFVHIPEASVRIRILRSIQEKGGKLPIDAVLRDYNAKVILQTRLGRLLESQQIELKNGRYHTRKPKMLYIAKIFLIMRRLVLGDRR
jgi:hypothetical protein